MINYFQDEASKKEVSQLKASVRLAALFVGILGFIKLIGYVFGIDDTFYSLGIFPRTFSGLKGILFAPLIHADFNHLFSNSIPFFILSMLILNFYGRYYFNVLFLIWFFDGVGVWLIGRESFHIGASGVIYGLATFAFFSGVLKKNRNLLAMSLVVLFLYGSFIWGIWPVESGISWEAHLFGFISGTFLAVAYKNKGPKNDPLPEWMNEEEEVGSEMLDVGSVSDATENSEEKSSPVKIIHLNYELKKEHDK